MRKAHLWISLVVGILVWGAYFTHFVRSLERDAPGALVWWFLGALAVTVAAETMATGLIGWLFRKRARTLEDGPTLNAALQASHIALMVLIGLILVLCTLLAIPTLFGASLIGIGSNAPVIAANVLLALVVIAELARAAFTLALLPKG